MKKRYVIVNKRRFTISMTILMTMMFMAIFSIAAIFDGVEGYASPTYEEVTVSKGDTVWSIAKEHCTIKKDIRIVTHEIGSLNNLSNFEISPGQVLKVPIEDSF